MNGIESMSTQLTTIPTPDEPKAVSPERAQAIAAKALETIQAQANAATKVSLSALEVCRKIGEAATKAKTALGHGAFTDWLKDCFSGDKPKSGTTFSVQWIRMCMRVHEVFVRLEGHKDREAILAMYGRDIKAFARVLVMFNDGINPLKFQPEKRTAKLNVGSGGTDGASDNEVSAKVLQRKLTAAEAKIAKLEAELAKAKETIKAQALEISTLKASAKEASKATKRKADDVVDAVVKVKALPVSKEEGEKAMEEARAKMRAAEDKRAKAKEAKAKPKAAPKPKATKPKTKPDAAPADIPPVDTSEVPADLLANASATLDTGMGANA